VISPQIKFKKKWLDNKGVSEIIGTILMLAITVVLFSSIMVFVTNMPQPISRPNADFLSSVTYIANNSGTVTLTHNGGEALNGYETQLLVIVDGNIRLTPRTMAAGGLGATWGIGQKWTCWISSLSDLNTLEIMVVDLHSNSQIWDGKISAGRGNNAPVILQRWTDSDTSTLTADPIIEGDVGFSLFVRVTDADNNLLNVTVDASSIGSGSNKGNYSIKAGVWEFKFTNSITQASLFDGKPLLIKAKDRSVPAHWANATFLLTVSASERGPQGDPGPQGNPGPPSDQTFGDEGLPSYLKYLQGDQGYVVLGEDTSNRVTGSTPAARAWGLTANIGDAKTAFYQYWTTPNSDGKLVGQGEWTFIRVGSKILKNLDATNSISIRNIFSNALVSPPDATSSGFSLLSVSGTANIYQFKFNASKMSPGTYSVSIDLQSSAYDSSPPAVFTTTFILYIESKSVYIFQPKITTYSDSSLTTLYGSEKTKAFTLSDTSHCIIYVAITMQTVEGPPTPSSVKVGDIKITDMVERSNLYGTPPTSDNMIGSVATQTSKTVYYFSIDLRLKNGANFIPATTAYTLTVQNVADSDEGFYTLSLPIWINAATQSENYIVASNGFGWYDSGSANFAHQDFLFQTENNRFFTTRVLDEKDTNPGSGGFYVYDPLYFDIDEDGDRDVLAAVNVAKDTHRLGVYINKVNEYGSWEPRTILSQYTPAGANGKILAMAYGDFENDGDMDWIISNAAGQIWLFINGNVVTSHMVMSNLYAYKLSLSEINGDGRLEVVALGAATDVGAGTQNCLVKFYKIVTSTWSLGDLNTPTPLTPDVGYVKDYGIADINNDGNPDIALISNQGTGGGVRWYPFYGTSTTYPATTHQTNNGIIIGADSNLQSTDNLNYQQLTEDNNNKIDQVWKISGIPATGTSSILESSLRIGDNSLNSFYFYYTLQNPLPTTPTWTYLFSTGALTKKLSDAPPSQEFDFPLPMGVSGTIYVNVRYSSSDIQADSIYMDLLNVKTLTSYTYRSPATGYQLCGDYNGTAISIGKADGFDNYLDVAVGFGDSPGGSTANSFKIIRINADASSSNYGQRAALPQSLQYRVTDADGVLRALVPDLKTFKFTDVNGDGLSDVLSIVKKRISATGQGSWANGIVYEWLNMGWSSTTVMSPPTGVEVKDFLLSYGDMSAGTGTTCTILSLAVADMYG